MAAPWEKYQGQDGPWARYQQPARTPSPQAQPQAVEPRVQRGGFQSQIGRTFAGQTPLTLTPEQKAQNDRAFEGVARGVPIGVAQSLPGIPGNVEALGRLALSPFGVSQERYLPTSEEVGTAVFGPPKSREEAAMRSLGEMGGGPGLIAGAKKAGGAAARIMARGSQPSQAAQEARAAGYVIPPNMAQEKPSLLSRALSAWGGKIKTQQAASAKNQDVTTLIAKRELGIPADQTLTDETFRSVRATAAKAHKALRGVKMDVVSDDAFRAAITAAREVDEEVAATFPELVSNKEVDTLVESLLDRKFTPNAGVGLVQHLRSEATANLKNTADRAKQVLGLAQRKAAEAIDDLMERTLAQAGNATLVNDYRQARQLIAKSHDLEAATNTATGEVSARTLAALQNRGRPLSGGLQTAANTASAFPIATQNVATFGDTEPLGILDMVGAAASAGAGRPDLAALLLGRPVARGLVLSKPYQNAVLGARNANVPGASAISPRLLGLLSAQQLPALRNEPR